MPQFPVHALSLKLEGHADLVSALVEVLPVYQRGQSHRHPLPHLLGVATEQKQLLR